MQLDQDIVFPGKGVALVDDGDAVAGNLEALGDRHRALVIALIGNGIVVGRKSEAV